MKKKYGKFQVTAMVSDAFVNAKDEINELYYEMREWADNMEMGGLDHLEKFQEVESAADALESANDYLDDICIESQDEITFLDVRKRYYARWLRLSNAVNVLEAVLEWANGQEWIDDMKEAVAAVEDIEFPSMYG